MTMNINIGQAKIAAKGSPAKRGSTEVVIAAVAVAASGRKVG